MRYSLWSHGRLVGHTDLDIHTVSSNLRQGFIRPAENAEAILRDATCVFRFMAEHRRHAGEDGPAKAAYLDGFSAACNRRDALDFVLRDQSGDVFECDFMRVYDLRQPMDKLEDADDLDLDASTLAEIQAEVEEWVAEIEAERASEAMFHSSWPPPPPEDERWETEQYHLQVFLKTEAFDLEPWTDS